MDVVTACRQPKLGKPLTQVVWKASVKAVSNDFAQVLLVLWLKVVEVHLKFSTNDRRIGSARPKEGVRGCAPLWRRWFMDPVDLDLGAASGEANLDLIPVPAKRPGNEAHSRQRPKIGFYGRQHVRFGQVMQIDVMWNP
jgi:hypothetical protein